MSKYTQPDCDVIILSGDIMPGVQGVMWASETFDKPVIYVPGNHEFYGGRHLVKHVQKMKDKAEGTNVHVLYNDTVIIDGVRFIGSTMWTDFDLFNDPTSIFTAQQRMNDFSSDRRAAHIFYGTRYGANGNNMGEPFTSQNSRTEHFVASAFIEETLKVPHAGKTVVVTHHAPSAQSVPERYKFDALTPAYASSKEHLMNMGVDLWTHGHMHDSSDYMIGNTRVVCNPRGYHGHSDLNDRFDPSLVVEI